MIELKQYFDLQKQIYDYFDYVEDWIVYPIEDSTNCFWYKNGKEVCFCENKDDLLNTDEGNYYSNTILHHRFLPKSIYPGKDYTMIVVDTHTDGNKFLQIFSNEKELN